MTIKQVVEHDSGFGFYLDKELTQEVHGMQQLLTVSGEARVKKVKFYFGSRDKYGRIAGVLGRDIVIFSSTYPGENVNLGHYLQGGVDNAVEMWFTLSKEQETEIGITPVCWG